MRIQFLRVVLGAGAMFGVVTGAWASSIGGRVLTTVGEPQPGQVRVFRLKVQDGHVDKLPTCTAETGPEGEFTCNNAEFGRYIIEVLATASDDAERTKRRSPLVFFYPGVSDLARATQVEVRLPGENWFDIRVPSIQTFSVSGPLERIPPDAELRLEAYGNDVSLDTAIPVTRTKGQHFLAVKVASGHYVLSAVWRDKATPHRMEAEVTVDASDVSDLELHEEAYVTLRGTVAGDSAGRVKMLLVYSEENRRQKAIVDVQNGRFTVPMLPAGRYYLALPIHSQEYVSSIKQATNESAGASFSTPPGAGAADIQVTIDSPGLELTGSVPAVAGTGSRARVVAQEISSKHVSTVLTDNSGRFSVSGLPPGSYLLFAWPEGEDPPYRSVDVLKQMERNATSVTVEKGALARSEDLSLLHPSRP